jgi:hypothetical protein
MIRHSEKLSKENSEKNTFIVGSRNTSQLATITNQTIPQSTNLRKSKSLKPNAKIKEKKKAQTPSKLDLSLSQSDMRSYSNDIKTLRMSKTLYGGNKKNKRVKFKPNFIELIEIESFKQYFDDSLEEEEENTREVPAITKKVTKSEETPLVKHYNHKLNSNDENKAKCCVCLVF